MSCTKCGGRRVSGPHYVRDAYLVESLEYACLTCGYAWRTPTADRDAGAKQEELLRRIMAIGDAAKERGE